MKLTDTHMLPDATDIEPLISELPLKEWHEFSQAFRRKHTLSPENNWNTLEGIFAIHLTPSNAFSPYGPMVIMDGKRSMIPDDLSDDHLNVMEQRAGLVPDPEFQARIYDILWLRRKGFVAAEAAVNAYIESGRRLEDPENWTYSIERYERAIRLASTLGKNHPLFKKALDHLNDRVVFYNGEDDLYFSFNGLLLLYEFKGGEPAVLANLARKIAERAAVEKNFPKAFGHYELEAKFHRRAGNEDKAIDALKAGAEQKVTQAEAYEAGGSHMAAHSFWNDAIQIYRKIPGSQDKIKNLYRRLNNAGQKMQAEMGSATTELNVQEWAEKTQTAFEQLTFSEALCQYALVTSLIDPVRHRADCEEQIRKHPIQFTFDAHIYDAAGRKVGIRPSMFTDDPEQLEAGMLGVMNQQAQIVRHLSVAGAIAPAMHKILEDHAIDEKLLESVIADSGFIPEGRMPIFFRAIKLGFEWDFSTALHLFIPQAENSLRHLLAQHGVITTSLDHVGIEEAWPLGKILSEPKLSEIFGDTLVFELRSLLLGGTGANFRNLLAHGLLGDGYLNSHEAFYLWWLLLRMTVLPTSALKAFIEQYTSTKSDAGVSENDKNQ